MFKSERKKRVFSDELINVIETGGYERMKQFMNDHPTKHLVDSEGTHLLHLAAKYNRVDLIRHLIELKCKVNVKDSTGATPYKIAKVYNNIEAAKMLVEINVTRFKDKINNLKRVWTLPRRTKDRTPVISNFCKLMTEDGMKIQELGHILSTCTTLCEVVKLNDPALTKVVLTSTPWGFDVETKGYEQHVVKEFDLTHIKVLFRYGAQSQIVVRTCLDYVMAKMPKYNQSLEGKAFFKGLFDWEIINGRNLEFLEDALMEASIESIEIFLQYNFHKTVKKKYGQDLLACLYGNRNPDVIQQLKNEDINVDGRGSHNYTPLHYAASKGVVENVKFLLERGADIDASHNYRMVPLYSALVQMKDCINKFRYINRRNKLLVGGIKDEIRQSEKCFKLLLQSGGNLWRTDPATCCRIFRKISEQYSEFSRYSMNTITVLLTQVATCDALDTHTKVYDPTKLYKYLSEDEESRSLWDRCREQSERLESHEICDVYWYGTSRKISMLTVLVEDPRKLGIHVKRIDLRTIERFMKSYNKKDLHEYYLDTLEEHVKIIEKLQVCRDAAARFVSKCIGISDPHNLIIERIVNYLSFGDLIVLDNLAVMYCI